MDPRLAANLAALQKASVRIQEATPEPTPEEDRAAMLAEQQRLRRPTPEESAKAWKARNKEFKRQRAITIKAPEEAVRIWLDGVRRRTGGDRPIEPGTRTARVGQTAEEQVIAKVQQTYATFDYAEGLESAILEWPLPMTFYDPVPPLCEVEEELLADPRPYEPPPEESCGDKTSTACDGRLLAGMRRAGEEGLHG